MKIVLELVVTDEEEREEALGYVVALARLVERRQEQGMPGALLAQGDGSVWVSSVTVQGDRLDTPAAPEPCGARSGGGTMTCELPAGHDPEMTVRRLHTGRASNDARRNWWGWVE